MDIEQFEQYRPLMFSIAYRMLGTVTDADDIVQETFLRVQLGGDEVIENPRAYLTTITTRLSLNRLKSAANQRETYLGSWLPEPIFTAHNPALVNPHERTAMTDSISIAFLLLLENLSPAERAAFILHDVFDYKFSEVAKILEKSDAACRQLCRRARQHLAANRPRFEAAPEEHERLLQSFIAVSEEGDIDSFLELLAEDVTLVPDGGGERGAAINILRRREPVAAFINGVRRIAPQGLRYEIVPMNGRSAILARTPAGKPFFALFVYGDGQKSHLLHVISGRKLRGLDVM